MNASATTALFDLAKFFAFVLQEERDVSLLWS